MACKGGTFQSGEDKYYPNAYYEIGDLFFTTRSENPNLRFGGTWELYGKGKVLVCVDPDDSDFSAVKKTGGEKEHTLTFDELPDRTVVQSNILKAGTGVAGSYQSSGSWVMASLVDAGRTGGQAHNNLQPYITCYIWIRIK